MSKPRCIYCDLLIVDKDRVKIGNRYRHTLCTKPARDRMPGRPLTATETKEWKEDVRTIRATNAPIEPKPQ